MVKVALKYCGSCNPQVRLGQVANYLAHLSSDFSIVPPTAEEIDVMVILCGCPRACGNRDEIRGKARECIVVAGESVNGKPVIEADLAAAAVEHLLKMRKTFN